jgi:arsenite methyltransferase
MANVPSAKRDRARPDYGIDAPGVIRWNAIGAGIEVLVSMMVLATGRAWAWWLVGAGLIWLLSPLAMLASSTRGKLWQRDRLLDSLGLRGDEQVLDVGTGHGLLAIGAAKRLTTGWVVGIDIWQQHDQANNSRESALKNAELEGVADRLDVRDGDARAIPFADATFDIVLTSFALHNIPGQESKLQACREIARVLKPGGRVDDYDMIFTTAPFVHGFTVAGLDVQTSGLNWRTYPPGRLIVGRKPAGGTA